MVDYSHAGVSAWISCRLGSGLPLQPGVTWPLFERIDAFAAQQAASWFMGGLERGLDTRRETLSLAHGRTLAEVVYLSIYLSIYLLSLIHI